MKRILTLFAVVFATVLFAQPQPVKWSTSYEVQDPYIKVIVHADIEEGWHLYSQNLEDGGPIPTSFYLDTSSAFVPMGSWSEGEPHVEYDPNFEMDLAFFSESADFTILLEPKEANFTAKGELEFMVCNDEMCLPPTYVDFQTEIVDAPLPSPWEGLGTTFWLGFLGGFAALIMPCIFPMIPLTVSFFTKQSKTRSEGIFKAAVYGLGIIVIYVGLGPCSELIFGADSLNKMATNPWFNLAFFALFVVFAASFFGAFEITLPSSWVNKADDASNKGGFLGIFFMGFTLSLVSFLMYRTYYRFITGRGSIERKLTGTGNRNVWFRTGPRHSIYTLCGLPKLVKFIAIFRWLVEYRQGDLRFPRVGLCTKVLIYCRFGLASTHARARTIHRHLGSYRLYDSLLPLGCIPHATRQSSTNHFSFSYGICHGIYDHGLLHASRNLWRSGKINCRLPAA
jgi:hypothetical protein